MHRHLSDLLEIPVQYDRPVGDLVLDSRQVKPGDVFFACQGEKIHGKTFIPQAVQAGAAAILLEAPKPELDWLGDIPRIAYPGLSKKMALLAKHFYANPDNAMQTVGVTGTNGKTSVSYFIAAALPPPCGLIGTLGKGIFPLVDDATHTTPDPLQLQKVLSDFHRQGVCRVSMEVSSHALAQERVAGVNFHTAVFTNLSHDHLDYHGNMEDYAAAKSLLFQHPGLHTAVVNADDQTGQRILAALPAQVRVIDYSIRHKAKLCLNSMHSLAQGLQLDISTPQGRRRFDSPLFGEFNAANLLAALGALLSFNIPLDDALHGLAQVKAPPGRMEVFQRADGLRVLVDYAHTPDALEKALAATRKHCRGKLWCVFGCGGDRDRGKRPLMGEIAVRLADRVILTDDNPRHEDPHVIIEAIRQGMPQPHKASIIREREQAIAYALDKAEPLDMVLIAGKGHETYQQTGDVYTDFSDRDEVLSRI